MKHKNLEKLNRNEIIERVAQLIAAEGLQRLTMRNIARHIGCSVGTLPHYFEGKNDIVIAALNWSNERIFNRLSELPSHEIQLANLYPLISASMPSDQQADTEWRVRLCLWDYAVTDDEMRLSVRAITQGTAEILQSLLLSLQAKGEIKPDIDAQTCATTLFQLCIGAGFNMLHLEQQHREQQLSPLFNFIEMIKA